MTDYQIQPNTRRCVTSGRELRPGESYFSVLVDEAGRLVRHDYSKEAWHGPPEGAFSFWQGKVQPPGKPRRPPIDDDLLLDCFTRLEESVDPGKLGFRYVLALLLLRRKRLKLEGSALEAGRDVLTLRCARTGARHAVIDPGLSESELESMQEDVFGALGWDLTEGQRPDPKRGCR
jgi:hypothetical protein